MLTKRIITAAILVPIVVLGTLFLNPQLFSIVLALVTSFAAWELCNLINIIKPLTKALSICVLVFLSFIISSVDSWFMPIIVFSSCWWLLNAYWIFYYPRLVNVWHGSRITKALNGLFMLAPMFLALTALQKDNAHLVLLLFVIVWGADTGAYIVGKFFGTKKLCPQVSPGKTIEGLLGGIISSMVIMYCYLTFFTETSGVAQYLAYLALSVAVSITSVIGDLFESIHKRIAKVKDSGALLPGHGGFLDRIDSLTSAAPVFCLIYFGALL